MNNLLPAPFHPVQVRNLTYGEKIRYGIPLTHAELEQLEYESYERGCNEGYDEGYEHSIDARTDAR